MFTDEQLRSRLIAARRMLAAKYNSYKAVVIDDMIQDAFIKGSLTMESEFWRLAVLRDSYDYFRMHHNDNRRTKVVILDIDTQETQAIDANYVDIVDFLKTRLRELSYFEAQIFLDYALSGASQRELSNKYKMSLSNINNHLHRARVYLRKHLND